MDDQYDGNQIYDYTQSSQARYEIRGNLIFEYARSTQAKYEIR